jgi:hypothetical protein
VGEGSLQDPLSSFLSLRAPLRRHPAVYIQTPKLPDFPVPSILPEPWLRCTWELWEQQEDEVQTDL